MGTHDDGELEKNMRAAFEPDAGSVDRVIAAAMRPRHNSMRLRVAAALVLACIALIAAILWRQSTRVYAESVRLDYVGSVALLQFPDGSSLIVSPDNAGQGPKPCLSLIFLEGDNP